MPAVLLFISIPLLSRPSELTVMNCIISDCLSLLIVYFVQFEYTRPSVFGFICLKYILITIDKIEYTLSSFNYAHIYKCYLHTTFFLEISIPNRNHNFLGSKLGYFGCTDFLYCRSCIEIIHHSLKIFEIYFLLAFNLLI